ncbi:7-cyano-7-deazaguanine synthase QueC [Chitinispirillales bacterium ANBcel5]|uniref:7-cyano-7-deazaguanine synthase QueC n=1 Tax=Cellulosispirillum alkaliphilum TaxID=3039283 RepID=UPI002A53E8D6|nr:7-cyano-7-deazaguanine synthase QueC [Chitinispirillales bacterium ANBcel5]
MKKKAVLLLSGGLDSATCAIVAKDQHYDLFALSFAYGQRHSVELDAAKKIADFVAVAQHHIVTIDLASFGGSALTTDKEVPKNRSNDENIPATYVPARNTIFLSFALGWAEVLNCRDIFIGVNAVDYSGYPDCRPEFIDAYQKMANLATKAAIEGQKVTIHTPLIDLKKSEIIKRGINLGMDYSLTHSCYDPDENGLACGECDSCRIRRDGFEKAGIGDPTKYKNR